MTLTSTTELLSQQQLACFFSRESDQAGIQEQFLKGAVASSNGFTYTVGSTIGANGYYDVLLTKYLKADIVWSVTWNGTAGGDDFGTSIAIDGSGDIVLGGTSYVNGLLNYDAVVLKYNPSGVLLWASTFDHLGFTEGFVSVGVDAANAIYACGGRTSSTLTDYLVVKFGSSGNILWNASYDHQSLDDLAVRLVISGTSVRVSGATQTGPNTWVMTTVAYSQSTGSQLAVSSSGGGAQGIDKVFDVTTDGSDTYVVGHVSNANGFDWKVVKLNASLSVVWEDTFDLNGMDDCAKSVVVNGGNVYVSGYGTRSGQGKNILTRKYSTAGALQWSKEVHVEDDDEAEVVRVSDDGHIVVAASSFVESNDDILLMKLHASNGNEIWKLTHNGRYNEADSPYGLVEAQDGSFYVAANVGKGNGSSTYFLMQFDEHTVSVPNAFDTNVASRYVTNRGQLLNTNGLPAHTIRFYNQSHFPSTYVSSNTFHYQMSELLSDTLANYHRVDMQFMKGNSSPIDYALSERTEQLHFYLAHLPIKSERTPVHNGVLRTGQYANTDIVFTSQPEGYRHWIVARQGAPTGSFEMKYTGQDSLSINANGELVISTGINDIVQKQPKAYTMNPSTGDLTLLAWQPSYVLLTPSSVGFSYPGTWIGTLVLELDQKSQLGTETTTIGNLDWSTFVGGTGNDIFFGSDASLDDHVWVTGETSNEPFAAINGETTVVGQFVSQSEMVVARFDDLCRLVFVTIFGGSGIDKAYDVAVDVNNRAMAVGWTQSQDIDFEMSYSDLNDTQYGGGATDGLVLFVDEDGTVLANSFIGGTGSDVLTSVDYVFDAVANEHVFWCAGRSNSGNGFTSATGGVGFQSHQGGDDGLVARINGTTELELSYISFFGSTANEVIYDIGMVGLTPVFLGTTEETTYSTQTCSAPSNGNFPNCAAGFQRPLTPGTDYFVARLSADGSALLWSTAVGRAFTPISLASEKPSIATYTTRTSFEDVNQVAIAVRAPQIFESSYEISTSGGFQMSNIAGAETGIYLAKWRVSGTSQSHILSWSSFFGSGDIDHPSALAFDSSNRLYLSGFTNTNSAQGFSNWCAVPTDNSFPLCNANSLNYMETTINNPLGRERAFIAAFSWNNNVLWSSFFGDGLRNTGRSVSAGSSKLFLAGRSQESWTLYEFNTVSDEDYWQPNYIGSDDGTIARFDIPTIVGVQESIESPQSALSVYPNPAITEWITIRGADFANSLSRIEVFDAVGKRIFSIPMLSSDGSFVINIGDLPPGLYIASVSNASKSQACRFVKQ